MRRKRAAVKQINHRVGLQLLTCRVWTQALTNTFTNELVPLFAATSLPQGGLALMPSQLAGPLAFSGAVFLLYAGAQAECGPGSGVVALYVCNFDRAI